MATNLYLVRFFDPRQNKIVDAALFSDSVDPYYHVPSDNINLQAWRTQIGQQTLSTSQVWHRAASGYTFRLPQGLLVEPANPNGTKANQVAPLASNFVDAVAWMTAKNVLAPYRQLWMHCPTLSEQLGWQFRASESRIVEKYRQTRDLARSPDATSQREFTRSPLTSQREVSIGQEQSAAYCQGCRRIHS